MTPARRSAEEQDVLEEVVRQRVPHLEPLVPGFPGSFRRHKDELEDALADEFVEHGLDHKDEPNTRGYMIERLVDRLMRA